MQLEALEEYLDGGVSVQSVVYQVTNGKNAMPAFGGRLSDEDIDNVSRAARLAKNYLGVGQC